MCLLSPASAAGANPVASVGTRRASQDAYAVGPRQFGQRHEGDLAAGELGLPYERIDVGGPFGRTTTPDYCAMNPNSAVPTLQEGDFTLWESNVILRYLCTAHAPGSPLWPDDLQQRANIDRWMDWLQTTLSRPQAVVFQGLIRIPPERRDTAAIEAAIVELGRVYGILDAELARHGQDYIAGPACSLADFAIGPHAHRWFSFSFPARRPRICTPGTSACSRVPSTGRIARGRSVDRARQRHPCAERGRHHRGLHPPYGDVCGSHAVAGQRQHGPHAGDSEGVAGGGLSDPGGARPVGAFRRGGLQHDAVSMPP